VSGFTQAERYIRINTSLGDDVLLLERFEGVEAVSMPFEFEAAMLTEGDSIDISGLLNQPIVVTVRLPDDSERNFHGYFNRIEEVESGLDGLLAYRGHMVPWLWYLSLFEDCRIFQNKSALDIVKQVFKDRGFTDFTDSTTGTYPVREYCVQYRETDLNFVSRLMEEEGIFYFFQHTPDKHTLVLADAATAFAACAGQSAAAYDTSPGAWQDEDVVLSLRCVAETRVGTYTVNDYDFTKPSTSINANLSGQRKGEFYEYPAKYVTKDDGTRFARIRMEEQEVRLQMIQGQSNCRSFESGYKFTLSGYSRSDVNQDYSLIRVSHNFADSTYRSEDTSDRPLDYRNTFEAIPNSTPFRPPRLARKPLISGSQTAVVVGKAGEEIWVDQYGRVVVQFFWDRAGTMDENSSCWVRVAQVWAGKGWGSIYTPRIGQEVIVDFLEGDPDRPIITGRVYNADQTTPYTLPDDQTKSTIKSMSSKGGGGFNEIRLEDKAGSEQIFVFGQKDQDVRITNDRREAIGNDRHLTVTRDKLEKVGRDSHSDLARDRIESIGRDHHLAISGKEAIKITGSHSMTVTGDVIEVFQGNHSSQVTQSLYIKGMQVVIEASTGLTINVGGNFITINSGGIQIQGTLVMINSGGSALSGSAGSAVSPIAPTDPTDADKADAGEVTDAPTASPGTLATMTLTDISPGAGPSAASAGGAAASTPVAVVAGPPPPQSAASNAPTHDPTSPDNQTKTHWIGIQLVDEDGNPVPGETYQITLPDGTTIADGTLDEKGSAKVTNIDPGNCQVTFPNLDQGAWEPK
jgi:type VI secretion system secreted protein VgrG